MMEAVVDAWEIRLGFLIAEAWGCENAESSEPSNYVLFRGVECNLELFYKILIFDENLVERLRTI